MKLNHNTKNNEAITSPECTSLGVDLILSSLVLSNYVEDMPTYEVIEDEVTKIKTVEPAKYVEDIVVLSGTASEADLRYINNLFDTNY